MLIQTQGLTSKEAAQVRARVGENRLQSGKKISPMLVFLSQFKDVMVIILTLATAVSFCLGETVEAIAILVILVLNALMGFLQEYKTQRALEALQQLSAPHCLCLRDNVRQTLPAADLVPGDVVFLEAGASVPADGLLISATRLQTDESMLTGESVGASKQAANPEDPAENAVGEPTRVFAGSTVTEGSGCFFVTHTGMNTQMGQIANLLDQAKEEPTPLQKRLAQMGKVIGIGCLVICALVAGLGVLRGMNPLTMLITGISLAVAAIPEGLPAVVTLSLAMAVKRMVKQQVLLRRLHPVETLGCATVICSDKTGTLTQNKMTACRLWLGGQVFEVSGEGYHTKGTLSPLPDQTFEKGLAELCQVAILCNHATPGQKGAPPMGSPTEAALLVLAQKCGYDPDGLRRQFQLREEYPFDGKRKRMSVWVTGNGRDAILTKGAAELLLPLCNAVWTPNGIKPFGLSDHNRLLSQVEAWASDGLRVLGLAMRPAKGKVVLENSETDLIFLGLVALQDRPRPEVKEAVAVCKQGGILPVMITGDHPQTAKAIAKEVGIWKEGQDFITGSALANMDDKQLEKRVGNTTVFARVTPYDKLRIVRAFQKQGQVVAMTGDGVNDAPAIVEADIGIAMGQGGTDVTRKAADMVLMDDNFATIVSAVKEGRVIYDNIRRFIRYLLGCNIGEVLTMLLSMLFGMPALLLPVHILLVNLATDGLPALALGVEPAEPDLIKRKPRDAKASVFAGGMGGRILFQGAIIGLTTIAAFTFALRGLGSLEAARTAALFTLVFTQLVNSIACKSQQGGLLDVKFFSNPKLLLADGASLAIVLLVIYLPPLQHIFSTVGLPFGWLLGLAALSLAIPLLSGIWQKCFGKHKH